MFIERAIPKRYASLQRSEMCACFATKGAKRMINQRCYKHLAPLGAKATASGWVNGDGCLVLELEKKILRGSRRSLQAGCPHLSKNIADLVDQTLIFQILILDDR